MKRIEYVDSLKFIAIFSIIILHMFSVFNSTEIVNVPFNNLKEIVRFGVPLFLMVSGMLLLNREIDLKLFFRKKIVRILYPVIFFLLIAYLLNIYQINDFFETYWYCWMMIGVYLAIPVVNIFIKNASDKELNYTILIFLFASLITTIAKKFNITIALDLTFFLGPVSYLVLGYYLSRKKFKLSPALISTISLLAYILITIYKIYGHDYLYINNHEPILSLLNISLPQVIQASSLFLLFKSIYENTHGLFYGTKKLLLENHVKGFITSVSKSSYGIYLVHLLFINGIIEKIFSDLSMSGTNSLITVIIVSIILLLVSWMIIVILSKIPVIKKFSGYG